MSDKEVESVEKILRDILDPCLREKALVELVQKGESLRQAIGPLLWNSPSVIAALLQDIVAIYPFISPPRLTSSQSARVSNAVAILRWVALNPETRSHFLNANIPLYLYPFLNATDITREVEILRFTGLGVICALSKVDDKQAVFFLLETEIFPLCLQSLELGSELSKVVAAYIIHKILLDNIGVQYVCATADRFFALGTVLIKVVSWLVEHPSARLLKYIINCYLRLYGHQRGYDLLPVYLPELLRNGTFDDLLNYEDLESWWSLQQLLRSIEERSRH